jgi:enolase-phosphatase E1
MIQFILMDIEGTTTSIDFVHQTLFPYAAQHLATFVRTHHQEERVEQAIADVKATVQEEKGQLPDLEGAIAALLQWIEDDRKHTALKQLQGYLWEDGYKTGQYQGHLYPDVIPVWKQWKSKGVDLGIYSSGSVKAQKLLFGYSEAGDVTDYLSFYFDTRIGHKREAGSYQNILNQIETPSAEVLFLSDVVEELDAAKEAGMQTIQLLRPGTTQTGAHPTVTTFDEIVL